MNATIPMIVESEFVPAWWLPGPHLQTVWPSLLRHRPALSLRSQRLELPDGDFLDLSRVGPEQGPCVLILHGLEGNLRSHYAAGLLHILAEAGYHAVFMHFRNCGDQPNRLARSYHSGETGDLQWMLEHLVQETGSAVRAAVGISLGGNVLLKWLGESGKQKLLERAVAVSVPFLLAQAAERMGRGWSRLLYQNHLLKKMRASYRRKLALVPPPLRVDPGGITSLREFDERITAPLHGFAGADDFYQRCSSRQFLRQIRTPTLILHARDDPFMWQKSIPREHELAPAVTLELSNRGGHVGFVTGPAPWRARYWMEERVLAYLNASTAE